jgi:RNA polymerase sigma-70 factor (ECF subfamily)
VHTQERDFADTPEDHHALLERVRRGSPGALGMLYDLYATDLYRSAFRITAASADAEDVVHDLFVGLPELLRRYEERDRLGAWLRRVVIRMSLARLRHARRRERMAGSSADGDRVSAPPGDPWGAIDLDRAVAALPDELRTVFVLRQIEGMSHDEIATTLGLTSGATRVRYLRALRRLRLHLNPSP